MLKITEKTMQHLNAHIESSIGPKSLVDLAKEVYEKYKPQAFTPVTHDFKEIVGYSECVEENKVESHEHVYCFKRKGRNSWSRGSHKRHIASSHVTIIVNHNCELVTAYYGKSAPREPWDKSMNKIERMESIEFWSCHALCIPLAANEEIETQFMYYEEFCEGKKLVFV